MKCMVDKGLEDLLVSSASSDRGQPIARFLRGTLDRAMKLGLVYEKRGRVNITQHGSEVLQKILIQELSSDQNDG